MTAVTLTAANMSEQDWEPMCLGPASWVQNDNASVLVKTGPGVLRGILCTAAVTSPTLKIYDGLDNSGAVLVKVFTPVAGTFYQFNNLYFGTGLFCEKGGTTAEFTIIYR